MKKRYLSASLAFFVVVCIYFFISLRSETSIISASEKQSRKNAPPLDISGVVARNAGPSTGRSSDELSTDGIDLLFDDAKNWLNNFSPSLTEHEEKLLLEKSARSSTTLTGLIWLHSPRSKEYALELITKHSDDNDAMRSLLVARSFYFDRRSIVPSERALEIASKIAESDADPAMAWQACALAREIGDKPAIAKWRQVALAKGFPEGLPTFSTDAENLLSLAGRTSGQIHARMLSQYVNESFPFQIFTDASMLSRGHAWEDVQSEIREHIQIAEGFRESSNQHPLSDSELLACEHNLVAGWQRNNPDDIALFGKPIQNVIDEIVAERKAIQPIADAQIALPALLQRASEQERKTFFQTAENSGLSAALVRFKETSPIIWDQVVPNVSRLRDSGRPIPSPMFWQSP